MLQRITATIAATLILWFFWWFFGNLLLVPAGYSLGGFALPIVSVIFWIVTALIPFLVWRRLRPTVKG